MHKKGEKKRKEELFERFFFKDPLAAELAVLVVGAISSRSPDIASIPILSLYTCSA